jgi:hypothetical protein
MLERLGRHSDALRLYCHTLGSLPLAEAYCDRCEGGGGALPREGRPLCPPDPLPRALLLGLAPEPSIPAGCRVFGVALAQHPQWVAPGGKGSGAPLPPLPRPPTSAAAAAAPPAQPSPGGAPEAVAHAVSQPDALASPGHIYLMLLQVLCCHASPLQPAPAAARGLWGPAAAAGWWGGACTKPACPDPAGPLLPLAGYD